MNTQNELNRISDYLMGLPKDKPIIVAIDGRCASGKSTLAASIAHMTSASIFHMDDFFLQKHQRFEQRFTVPGENVDHERVQAEILIPLRAGSIVSYRPFDCHSMELLSPVTITPSHISIVEGSYSCHKDLFDYYDYRIFVSTEYHTQLERISQRNGSAALINFRDKWIPLEEEYFKAYNIEGRSDIVVTT